MDGYNFFNRISYLYNRSSNYLNLLAFHNDYTFGIISKTYRMKELGLYIIDKNNYYSSKSNKYLYFSEINNVNNISILKTILSTYVYLSKYLNRTLIFPRLPCNRNKVCTFVRLYNLEYFEKICNISYRENSFLFSKKIPSNMIKESITIKLVNINSNISFLSSFSSQLLIIKQIKNYNFDYLKCFRNDNWWQRNFK